MIFKATRNGGWEFDLTDDGLINGLQMRDQFLAILMGWGLAIDDELPSHQEITQDKKLFDNAAKRTRDFYDSRIENAAKVRR